MCEVRWKWKFIYGIIGGFIGISVFFFSFFQMNNLTAGCWGLASAFFAILYAIYVRRYLRQADYWYQSIKTETTSLTNNNNNNPAHNTTTTANNNPHNNDNNNPNNDNSNGVITNDRVVFIPDESELNSNLSKNYSLDIQRAWFIIGAIGMLGSFVAFLAYIVLSSLHSESLTAESQWMSAVWAFMTLKWSFGLSYQVHKFNSQIV